ncbi:MAG: glycosyltransferase family 2 protein [Vulcanisaeta sp. AZ3]
MLISYETIIVIIYLVITIASFYPIIYQLVMIKISEHNVGYTEEINEKFNGRITMVIPAKSEPLDLIEHSMSTASMIKQYAHVVYVLDNYSNELISMIKAIAEKYGVKVIHREKPQGYKGGALNHVIKRLELNNNDYMLVLDIDSTINPEAFSKFKTMLGSASALVPRWIVSNKDDSLLARGQWIGYLLFFKILKVLNKLINWVPILGSGSLVSVGETKKIGYWPESILEDVELGVRFFINGLRVRYIDNVAVGVEAPVNYHAFVKQQLRWSFGTGYILRKYSLAILRRRHGFTVLLYLSQYFAYVLQLLSILMLVIMSIVGIAIPLWAFAILIVLVMPTLITYLYVLLKLDKENGGNPRKDIFAINSINLAYVMALPRIAIASIMGLLGIDKFEWIPTPKGSQKWAREGINLLPEITMTILIIIAFVMVIAHMLLINLLIVIPYLAGYVRGLWRIIENTL